MDDQMHIGKRIGPFEVIARLDAATERGASAGSWYVGQRTLAARKRPESVRIYVLDSDAAPTDHTALHDKFALLQAVDDPRIPKVVAFYEGLGALVCTPQQGRSLDQLVAARRDGTMVVDTPTLIDLLIELVEAVASLHRHGGVHGALSPTLIRLDRAGQVSVAGVGDLLHLPDGWKAPEIAQGKAPDMLTDQWCLGAIGMSLVTGKAPFDDLAAAARGRTEPALAAVAGQSVGLARVLRRMMAGSASNRYPTLQSVKMALLGLARQVSGLSRKRDVGAWLSHCPTSQPTLHKEAGIPNPPDDDAPDLPKARTREAAELKNAGQPLPIAEDIQVVAPSLSGGLKQASRAVFSGVVEETSEDDSEEEFEDQATVLFTKEMISGAIMSAQVVSETGAPLRTPPPVDPRPTPLEDSLSFDAAAADDNPTFPTAVPDEEEQPTESDEGLSKDGEFVAWETGNADLGRAPIGGAPELSPPGSLPLAPAATSSSSGPTPQMIALIAVGALVVVGLIWLLMKVM